MIQTLVWATTRANAMQAYKEKRLQAQNPETLSGEGCQYRIDVPGKENCGCAIGVSLSEETHALVQDHLRFTTVMCLAKYRLIAFANSIELKLTATLQQLHDEWSQLAGHEYAVDAEKRFIQFLEDNP
jgi:hypothetical protein